ncbi:MAG: hypothetical protein ACREOG_08145, partial [Gemmatimonadaceae bacterium]
IGVRASRAWRLATWDRFMIPKPFARITLRYGYHSVPNAMPDATLKQESERLGSTLHELAAAQG